LGRRDRPERWATWKRFDKHVRGTLFGRLIRAQAVRDWCRPTRPTDAEAPSPSVPGWPAVDYARVNRAAQVVSGRVPRIDRDRLARELERGVELLPPKTRHGAVIARTGSVAEASSERRGRRSQFAGRRRRHEARRAVRELLDRAVRSGSPLRPSRPPALGVGCSLQPGQCDPNRGDTRVPRCAICERSRRAPRGNRRADGAPLRGACMPRTTSRRQPDGDQRRVFYAPRDGRFLPLT
jgi:hypothetical protein